jgi:hypothetical protein
MERFSSIDLENYRGDNYFLVGYVEPDPDDYENYDPEEDAENYGWSLVQKAESPLDEKDEVVRMDTRHSQPISIKNTCHPIATKRRRYGSMTAIPTNGCETISYRTGRASPTSTSTTTSDRPTSSLPISLATAR